MIGICADCRRKARDQKRATEKGVTVGSTVSASGRG